MRLKSDEVHYYFSKQIAQDEAGDLYIVSEQVK